MGAGAAHKATTQSKQPCDLLLGHDPPVEKRHMLSSFYKQGYALFMAEWLVNITALEKTGVKKKKKTECKMCFSISCLCVALQRTCATAAVAAKGFWTQTIVTRAQASAPACRATPGCSVTTVKRDSSPTAPAVACPAPVTLSGPWTRTVTGQAAPPASPARASCPWCWMFTVSTYCREVPPPPRPLPLFCTVHLHNQLSLSDEFNRLSCTFQNATHLFRFLHF